MRTGENRTIFNDARHMTTDTVGKRVNGVGHVVVDSLVTLQALKGSGLFGLKLGRWCSQAVDIVA